MPYNICSIGCLGLSPSDVFPVKSRVPQLIYKINHRVPVGAINPSLLVILHKVPEPLNVDGRNTSRGRERSEEVGVTQDAHRYLKDGVLL
ncbi:hypothetical protein Tco_0181345, partial [Tanacetum coccineum]